MERPTPPSLSGGLGPDLADAAEAAGVRKAGQSATSLLVLGALAGAFIALGSAFSLVAVTGAAGALPYGLVRLVAGLAFCLGLVLVVLTGAELFTGNVLLVMAWTRGRLGAGQVLRCWGWVLLGNLLGAVGTAGLLVLADVPGQGQGRVGAAALAAAEAKAALGPLRAFALGVLCNGLVCLAVWCSYGARSLADRVLAVLFPVTAFVALGGEHSIANLFVLPLGLWIEATDAALASASPATLTWSSALLGNLLPVVLGNVVGGSLLVALPYGLAYPPRPPAPPPSS